MRHLVHASLALAASAFVLAAVPAKADEPCPEGRTAGGECVNPGLAESQRQTAVIFAQSQISKTAFPVLPVEDRDFRYPNALVPPVQGPSIGGDYVSP